MIKGIFFDAAGVLYQRSSPTLDFAIELARQDKYYREPTPSEKRNLEDLRVSACQGQTSHEEYWQEFLSLSGIKNFEQQKAMIQQITDYSESSPAGTGQPGSARRFESPKFYSGYRHRYDLSAGMENGTP